MHLDWRWRPVAQGGRVAVADSAVSANLPGGIWLSAGVPGRAMERPPDNYAPVETDRLRATHAPKTSANPTHATSARKPLPEHRAPASVRGG